MPDPLEPYATGEDLIKRYDIDLIADLCQDSRAELDYESDLSNLTEHPNVVSALEDATAEIDVALFVGGRYTPQDLQLLLNPVGGPTSNVNSRKHLIRITCALAMAILVERRMDKVSQETAEWVKKTGRDFLNALRRGEDLFGFPPDQDNFLASGTIDVSTVESVQIENLNLLPGRMSPYFPGTEQRTPRSR